MFFKGSECFDGVALVIGNGPSAKLLDFRSSWLNAITTVGMNSAFRFWDKVDFRPTYYICMDDVVIKSIADDIMRLIEEGRINQFFLKDSIKEIHPEAANYDSVVWHSEKQANGTIFRECPISTGGWAIRWMINKGCKYISTIGIDGINTEVLSESEKDENSGKLGLKVKRTPEFNPNYFFSDYQKEGDKYQVPNNPGYLKANGRPFHEDALLSIHRFIKENSLDTQVVDLSPLSNHGIFPKRTMLSFKELCEISIVIDVQSIGLHSAERICLEIDRESLSQNVFLLLPEADQGCLEGAGWSQRCYVQYCSGHETTENLFEMLRERGSPSAVVVLSSLFESVGKLVRIFQEARARLPGSSVVAVSQAQKNGRSLEFLGAAFNIEEFSKSHVKHHISGVFCEQFVSLMRLSGASVIPVEFSQGLQKAASRTCDSTESAVWSLFCGFSESFPQIEVGDSTPELFLSKTVWVGPSKSDDIGASLEDVLSFCFPRSSLYKTTVDFLTVKIDGIDFRLDEATARKIDCYVESGYMIEWEVSGFGDTLTFDEFISHLDARSSLDSFCASYPLQSFVNVDGATPRQRQVHADILLLTKYLMGEGQSNILELPSEKASILYVNHRMECEGSSQALTNPVAVCKKSDKPISVIKCNFGVSTISSIRFQIKLLSQCRDELHFRVCRDGASRFESSVFIVNVRKGVNTILLPIDFSATHVGCRLEFWGGHREGYQVVFDNVEALGYERFPKIKFGAFGSEQINPALNGKRFSNREYLRESKGIVAILDPDGVDLRGHYLAYDRKLSAALSGDNIATKILCRNDINLGENSLSEKDYLKCFDKHSWTIATNMSVFAAELDLGLSKLRSVIPYDSSILLYFYTGSVHHLSVLCDTVRLNSNVYVHLTLFWEMIRDTSAEEYLSSIRDAISKAAALDGRVIVSAPTKGVQKIVQEATGVQIPVAPHPSTAVDDRDLFNVRGEALNSNVDNKKRETHRHGCLGRVVFPGASTMHKGYELGVSAAVKLADMGYSCWVREEKGHQYSSGLELIPKHLSDEGFQDLLSSADVIVLPYQPEGFSRRTSGLVIDALYLGVPVVVINGTWLSEVVSEYKSGLCVESCSEAISIAVQEALTSSSFTRGKLLDSAVAYHIKNSWRGLAEFIIHEFEFDYINYKYANYLFRSGCYEAAMQLYKQLKFVNGCSVYEKSIKLCETKIN